MSVARYIILCIFILGVILTRYLTSGGHTHLPQFELLGYWAVMSTWAFFAVREPKNMSAGYWRELIHRKFGFTCVFSLACAALLTVVGAAWLPPKLSQLPIPTVAPGENGYREPAVVRAGDSVRVHFHPERRLPLRAISGLWKANVIKATLVTQDPRRLLPLEEVSSLPASETWEDVDPKDGRLYFRPTRQESAVPRFRNEPLRPWIEFRVPYDESLVGEKLTLHVEMSGVLPHLEKKGSYQTREFRLIEDVAFYIADGTQYAAFQDFEIRRMAWERFQRFRFWAAMTFLMCGAVFLMMVHRKPRPAGLPVRMLSRRIGS